MALPASGYTGQEVLSQPPPSPQLNGGGPTGQFSMNGLAPPVASNALPPAMLQGMMQVATQVGTALDSLAQAAPDLAEDFGAVKDALQAAMAKLMVSGAGPTSPSATGPQFPGGGMDRGIPGSGTV
jgi:hypothetical protein